MKRLLPLVFSFSILLISFPVYAAVNITIPSTYSGVRYKDSSVVTVYSTTSSSYSSLRVYEISGEILSNSSSFYVDFSKDTSGSSTGYYALCFSSVRLSDSVVLPRPASYTSRNWQSTLVKKSKYYKSDGILDLTQESYDSDAYYYLFLEDQKEDVDLIVVPRSVPTPTPSPTPIPTSIPTSTPLPPVSDYPGKAIVDKFTIDQNQTILPSESYKVFPYDIQVTDSSSPPDIDSGKTYILHYRFSLPARFFYAGHEGTGYSYPTLINDLSIKPYFSKTGSNSVYNIGLTFSQPSVYISQDVSCDYLNNLSASYMDNQPLLSGSVGYAMLNVPVVDTQSLYSYDLVVDWSIVLNAWDNDLALPTSSEYQCTVTLNSVNYRDNFKHVSDGLDSSVLGQIKDNSDAIKDEQAKQDQIDNEHYQQEQDKIAEAEGTISDGAGALTDTLSSWEIFTMPFQLVKDFASAIASEGSTGLTFPSYTLLGHQLWPSYTFDLKVIADKFPALYNALHLITGIMVVSWFIHYCWRKWHILVGDDMPES